MSKIQENLEKVNTGFSNLSNQNNTRLITSDGRNNIRKLGLSFFDRFSLYRTLIVTTWTKFFLVVIGVFIVANLIFGLIYFSIGVEHLGGTQYTSDLEAFLEVLFFSAQTFTTVGYGRISPTGLGVNIVASLESLIGVLIFAMFAGVLYGRFSRPVVKIIKSKNALISDYQGIKALMFRIANAKSSTVTDAEVELRLSILKKDNGVTKRLFYELKTEISKINFLTLSWTVVHPINSDSPLWGLSEQEVSNLDAEVIVLFRGFEDTFSQTVHSWISYTHDEIVWNAKFKSIIAYDTDGLVSVDLSRLNDHELID